jgi:arsenate reductase (glutaredoxin)
MAEADVIVWYNPRCSKCRGAEQVLAAYGVPAQKVFYLDDPPSRAEITRVLVLLGAADPRALMRIAEQRPVVIWADRAVIARPPELLLPLLETGPGPASP